MKVIVSCITKFHAFGLAEQLERHKILASIHTSYSYQKNKLFRKFVKRIDKENIASERFKTNVLLGILLKVFPNPYVWNSVHDFIVSKRIKNKKYDFFIGWSGMSLRSLKVAKKKGAVTILERGSSHILYQTNILKEEFQKFNLTYSPNNKLIQKELAEYEFCDYISIPSKFVYDTFILHGVSSSKLILNNYGASDLFRNLNKRPAEKFSILYLGTLNIRKGLIYLFEAIENLSINPENYEVLFVGSIDPQLESVIEEKKRANWHFLGHVNHYQLPEIINRCSIAVQPSLEEGLSTVIAQLMACGIPVIASENSGGGDLISHSVNGFITPIRNAEMITKYIELLYADHDLFEQVKKSLKSGRTNLTWEAYGDRYLENLNNARK